MFESGFVILFTWLIFQHIILRITQLLHSETGSAYIYLMVEHFKN